MPCENLILSTDEVLVALPVDFYYKGKDSRHSAFAKCRIFIPLCKNFISLCKIFIPHPQILPNLHSVIRKNVRVDAITSFRSTKKRKLLCKIFIPLYEICIPFYGICIPFGENCNRHIEKIAIGRMQNLQA